MITSIILRILFAWGSHPINLIIIILTQTIILCVLIFLRTKIRWFSYILFLIFLGGLIVLFIYISRLASNELFTINTKILILITPIVAPILYFLTTNINSQIINNKTIRTRNILNLIYSKTIVIPTLVTILYLLLTLIIAVKITSKYEAPLRRLIFNK